MIMQTILRLVDRSCSPSFLVLRPSCVSIVNSSALSRLDHRIHFQAVLSKRRKIVILTEDERKSLLEPLLSKGWSKQENRDAIYKEFQFKDFNQAWKVMCAVAPKADEMDHHPEWFNVYNKVNITLSTHDRNGLSKRDIRLANIIEEAVAAASI